MLVNSENLKSLGKSEFFLKMLGELPWAKLHDYIQTNTQILKACTIGGYRLEPKHRDRIEKQVLREAEKNTFSEAVCNSLFAFWYPIHNEIHENLENYFHSDEYKKYRESLGLDEEQYVLPDEKFEKFFSVNELTAWKILLLFSPLKFSEEQGKKILECTKGSSELLETISHLENELAEKERKISQLGAENSKLTARQQSDSNELQTLKKQNRDSKNVLDQLQKKYESSQGEIRRLSAKIADAASESADKIKAELEVADRKVARAQSELDRVNQELQNWKTKYEEQRLLNRSLEESSSAAVKEASAANSNIARMQQKIDGINSFVDTLLGRIDWMKVGSAMKLTPTMRRNFNSLIKKMNYEEDQTLHIEDALPDFWKRLIEPETLLVNNIAKSNINEVSTGDVEGFWNSIKEEFADVQINLEARLCLLDMLHEIFFQLFDDSDLEKPIIPKKK